MLKTMSSVEIRYVSYRSLRPLFDIVHHEKNFKVQVVSLEPFSTLVELFNYKNIRYKLILSQADSYSKRKVNIIVHDSNIECRTSGKYLLYQNIRNRNFVQVVFSIGVDEKMRYCCLKYGLLAKKIVKAHGRARTLGDLEKIITQTDFEMPPLLLSYIETVVLLCVRRSKFEEICKQALQIDSRIDNTFLIWLTLKELTDKDLVARSGNYFKANVSKELLERACKNVNIDTSLFL